MSCTFPQVKIHNDVMSVPPAPDPKNAPHYHRWMPSEVERVDVREFSSQLDGVFSGNNNWLLSLIQSRYIPVESLTRPEVSLTSIQHTRSQPMFDLSKLESDIVRYFIAGKRTIEVGTLWKPFRFKSSKVGRTSVPARLVYYYIYYSILYLYYSCVCISCTMYVYSETSHPTLNWG